MEYYDIANYEFIPDYRLKVSLSMVVFMGANLQTFLHFMMAVNRLTAFYFSQRHDTMWSGCTLFAILTACTLVAAVLGPVAFVYFLITVECEGCEEYVYLMDVFQRSVSHIFKHRAVPYNLMHARKKMRRKSANV